MAYSNSLGVIGYQSDIRSGQTASANASGQAALDDLRIEASRGGIVIEALGYDAADANAAGDIALSTVGGAITLDTAKAAQDITLTSALADIDLVATTGSVDLTCGTGAGDSVSASAFRCGIDQVDIVVAATALTEAASGSIFKVDEGGTAITLPTVVAGNIGINYTFVAATTDISDVSIAATAGQTFLGTVQLIDAVVAATADTMSFHANTTAGSWVKCTAMSVTAPCWFVEGIVGGASGVSFA